MLILTAKNTWQHSLKIFFGFLRYLLAHFQYGLLTKPLARTYLEIVTGSSAFMVFSGCQVFSPVSHNTSTSIVCFPSILVSLWLRISLNVHRWCPSSLKSLLTSEGNTRSCAHIVWWGRWYLIAMDNYMLNHSFGDITDFIGGITRMTCSYKRIWRRSSNWLWKGQTPIHDWQWHTALQGSAQCLVLTWHTFVWYPVPQWDPDLCSLGMIGKMPRYCQLATFLFSPGAISPI